MHDVILEEAQPVVHTAPEKRLRCYILILLALCVVTVNACTWVFYWQPKPFLSGSFMQILQDPSSSKRQRPSLLTTTSTTMDSIEGSDEPTSFIFDQSYEPLKYAIQELQVVQGSNRDDTIRQCERFLSKDNITGGFLPVGVNLILEEEEEEEKKFPGAVYLCERRIRIQEASEDEYNPHLPILQWIAVLQGTDGQCSQGTLRLAQPRPQVVVCVKYTTLQEAKATNIYVSDLTVTYAKQYNNDRPGWQTFPTSIHMSTASFSSDEAQERERLYGAFLNVKRSPRSIVGMEIVHGVTWLQAAEKCYHRSNDSRNVWEPAEGQGNSILDHGVHASIALVCLEWSHIHHNKQNTTKALLDVKPLFKEQKECPQGYNKISSSDFFLQGGGASWEWCLHWGNPFQQASIGDFVLVHTNDQLFPGLNWLTFTTTTTTTTTSNNLTNEPYDSSLKTDFSALVMYRKTRYRGSLSNKDESKSKPMVLDFSYFFSEEELAESISFARYQQQDPHHRRVPLRAVRDTHSSSLSFKVLVLSDIHSSGLDFMYCRSPMAIVASNCSERIMFDFFNELLDVEKPQLVVFDGDNVHKSFGLFAIHSFMDQMEKRQIPWTMVFGNHDDEGFFGLSRKKMMNKMRQKAFAYIHPGPEQVDGIGNFALTIQTSENEEEKELVRLYFLDSHATADSTNFPQQNGRNDWIKPSQLDFYQALSNSLNKHTEIPGVLFFHIPLPEYSLVSPDEPLRMGGHFEKVDAPFVNTGLFSLLVEQDHIKAIVVGHDHANDFCYQRESIHLCYAGCPGFGLAYGRHDLPRRVRILEWKFDLPKKKQKLFTYERIYGDKTKEKKDFQELYAI